MEHRRTMYLLSLLNEAASPAAREEVRRLFQKTVETADEFDTLRRLMETTLFFQTGDRSLLTDAQKLCEASYYQIENAAENIMRMQVVIEQIGREVQKTDDLMQSPAMEDALISAVSRARMDAYRSFLQTLSAHICYYLAAFYDPELLRPLVINRSGGFQETLSTLAGPFAEALLHAHERRRMRGWKIFRRNYDSHLAIGFTGVDCEEAALSFDELCRRADEGTLRRLAPNLYLQTDGREETLFGIGNLTGITPDEGLSILEGAAVTSISIHTELDAEAPLENLLETLSNHLGTTRFCLPAREVAAALNRSSQSVAAASRRKGGRCVICGARLENPGMIACSQHFRVNA